LPGLTIVHLFLDKDFDLLLDGDGLIDELRDQGRDRLRFLTDICKQFAILPIY
jgi:hypothetical protein